MLTGVKSGKLTFSSLIVLSLLLSWRDRSTARRTIGRIIILLQQQFYLPSSSSLADKIPLMKYHLREVYRTTVLVADTLAAS